MYLWCILYMLDVTGCLKKKGDLCSGLNLGPKTAENQKVEENRPPLKFNFTYWEVFSALYTTCIHHVYCASEWYMLAVLVF